MITLIGTMGRIAKSGTIVMVLSAMTLSGCQLSTLGVQNTTVEEANRDVCSKYRRPFEVMRIERAKRIQQWAAGGAAVGASVGAASDGLEGALKGLLIGAFAGAVGGYLADLKKRSNSTAGMRKAIAGDAYRDRQETDQLLNALQRLNGCRVNQIQTVRAKVQNGSWNKATARNQLALIQRDVKKDNGIIDSVTNDLTKSSNTYVRALKSTGANNADSYVASIQRYEPRVSAPQPTAAGGSTGSLRVSRNRSGSSVSQMGYANKELQAANEAHVDSILAQTEMLENTLL